MNDNQEIEAAELAVRGLHTCAWCQMPTAAATRSICEKCLPADAHGPVGMAVEPAGNSVEWWQQVAEAKQEEAQRLHAALEILAQVRHVSGSAQAAFRSNLRLVDAVLQGADVRDLATALAIAAGRWRHCDGCERYVAGETWRQVEEDEVCRQLCHRHG